MSFPARHLFDGSRPPYKEVGDPSSDEEEDDYARRVEDYYESDTYRPMAATPVGRLSLICGPMWAGKSTELLRRVRHHAIAHGKVVVITHVKDVRFVPEMARAMHGAAMFHAIAATHLGDSEVTRAVAVSDVVAVDEGHFFDDLAPMCNEWADEGKIVIVSALDATFERKPFANVTELCPDAVDKLTAVCFHCTRDAPFTRRITSETDVEVVGTKKMYEAVCRACYNNKGDAVGH